MLKRGVYVLVFLILINSVSAATYFVSQSGAGSGNGLSISPTDNSMSIANYNAGNLDASTSPGDTIYLCGTITTGLKTTEGGSVGTYLIFDGDCSIQGGTDVDFEVGSTSSAITIDVDYTRWTWIQTSGVTGQGMLTTYTAGVNYLQIRNSYFTSSTIGAGGLFIDGASNVIVGGSESYSNLFENIGSTHSGGEDIALRGQPATPTNSVTISYNELKGNGVSAGVDGIMTNDDEQDDVGDPGKEIVIEYNYIHDHWKENEIDIKGGGYFIIRKNIIDGPPDNYDVGPSIVIFHAGTDHIWFYGNVVRDYSTTGIIPYDSNPAGGLNQPVEYIYLWSNLVYGIGWDGLIFHPSANQDTKVVRVWGNTIVSNAKNPSESTQTGIRFLSSWQNPNDFLMYNNIIANNREGEGSVPTRQMYLVGTSNFDSDYNQYYSSDGPVSIYYNGLDRNFDYWQSTAGKDLNGVMANPGFTSRGSNDYTTTNNLVGAEDGPTLRNWHSDATKGLSEDADLNSQACGETPGGTAYCAKGMVLADRDDYNGGVWGKGAYVYASAGGGPTCDCSGSSCESPGNTGRKCDGCNWVSIVSVPEICDNGIDENCDGQSDEGCSQTGIGNKILPTQTYNVLKASSAPIIDGNMQEFQGADYIELTNSFLANGTYYLLWDDNYFYLAGNVFDNQLNALYTSHDASLWSDDAVETFFDTLNNDGDSMQSDDYKVFLNVRDVTRDARDFDVSWEPGIIHDMIVSGTIDNDIDSDTGYSFEMAIPWSDWVKPNENDIWGFDLALNDRNREDSIWANLGGSSVNSPVGWGNIKFSNEIFDITSTSACSSADTSGDSIVDISELLNYIADWKAGSVVIGDLLTAIGEWKNGC